MNSKFYKYCAVPQCKSTTIKTPNKLFIYVPHKKQIREKWLKLARRDPKCLHIDSRMYFCEDHFDLPNDMVNYMEYKIMKSVSQIRIRPDCTPSKFECQLDRVKRTCSSTERLCVLKKRRMMAIKECLNESQKNSTQSLIPESNSDTNLHTIEEIVQKAPKIKDKCVQVFMAHKFRSQGVQAKVKSIEQAVSPMKIATKSVQK